jgi:hypothetical protein
MTATKNRLRFGVNIRRPSFGAGGFAREVMPKARALAPV